MSAWLGVWIRVGVLDAQIGKLGVVGLELRNYPALRGPQDGPYACPCCRYVTLGERGGFEICPVCLWEDDGARTIRMPMLCWAARTVA
nr:CPCC family cysteine-rich protein [Nonomuraea coxensis]